jgi:KDO2-lipid IV(A) lauroyltransferase
VAEHSLGRRLRYIAETAGVILAYGLFRAMPIDWASATGGWLGRTLGPRFGLSWRARHNLALAMPELGADEVERIVAGMWDNLGRFAGEMPHVARLDPEDGRVEIVGLEHVRSAAAEPEGCIFFSGHLANWELLPIVARHHGIDLESIYRAANNPWIDQMIQNIRTGALHPKGAQGARRAVAGLRAARPLALLIDQKMNDGIAVPFFGRPAMTAPALVDLARKFKVPAYPARIERLDGARFRITVLPPIRFEAGPDRHADLAAGMTEVNALLESWIRERPAQWLWLHRRWPES